MKAFLHIAALALCLSTASAFAAATYTRDADGRILQVATVDAQGHPQVVEYRYTDDKGSPTRLVYAVRLNAGPWCVVPDGTRMSSLTTCLTGWHR